MKRLFVFNEEDIAKMITIFINQNVGGEAIKEVEYDIPGSYTYKENLINEAPVIIDVKCKLDLTEVIKYFKENSSCTRYISSWKDICRKKRNEEIVKQYNDDIPYIEIAKAFGISNRRVHQILNEEN